MVKNKLGIKKVCILACVIIAVFFLMSLVASAQNGVDKNSSYKIDLICNENVHQVPQKFETKYQIEIVNFGEKEDTILLSIGGKDFGIGIETLLLNEDGKEIDEVFLKPKEKAIAFLLIKGDLEIKNKIEIEIAVKGESKGEPKVWDTVVTYTQVKIEDIYGVEIEPSFAERKIRQGRPAFYLLSITNTGNVEDTYYFKFGGKDYEPENKNIEVKLFFPVEYRNITIEKENIGKETITLPQKKSMFFVMRIWIKEIGSNNKNIAKYHITITAISKSNEEVKDTTETITHVILKAEHRIELECRDYIHKTVVGKQTDYFIKLTNKGDVSEFVKVWYEHYYGENLTTELYRLRYYHIDDENKLYYNIEDEPIVVGDQDVPIFHEEKLDYYQKVNNLWIFLRPGKSVNLLLRVTIENSTSNNPYIVEVVAKGIENEARIKTLTYIVSPEYDFTFNCENTNQKTTYGEVVLYKIELENTGNVQDTFNLRLNGKHLNFERVYAEMIIYWDIYLKNENNEIYFKDNYGFYYLPYQNQYISKFADDEIKVTLQPSQAVNIVLLTTIYYKEGVYEVGIIASSCTVKHAETVLTYTEVVEGKVDIELFCDDTKHYTAQNVPTNYRLTIKNTGTISIVAKIWLAGKDYDNPNVTAKLLIYQDIKPKEWDNNSYSTLEISLMPNEKKDFILSLIINASSGIFNIDVCSAPYRHETKENNTDKYQETYSFKVVNTYTHIIQNPNYGVELTCKDNKHKIMKGKTTNYIIEVRNTGDVQTNFRIFVGSDSIKEGITAKLYYIISIEEYDNKGYYFNGYETLNLTLEPNEKIKLLLRVKVDYEKGEYEVKVTAESIVSTGEIYVSDTISTLTIVVNEVLYGVKLYCQEPEQKVAQNQSALYYMIVQNTGNVPDFIRIVLNGEALKLEGVTTFLYFPKVAKDDEFIKDEDIFIRDSDDLYLSIKYDAKITTKINKGISIYLPSNGKALIILEVLIGYPNGSYEIGVKARAISDLKKTETIKTLTHIIGMSESNIDLECFNTEIKTAKNVPANYIISVKNLGKQRDTVILTPGGRHYNAKGVNIELYLLNFVLPNGKIVEEEKIIEVNGNTTIADQYLTELKGPKIKVGLNPLESIYVLMRVTISYNFEMKYEISLTGEIENSSQMRDTIVTTTKIIPLPEYGVKLYCKNPSHYVVYGKPTSYYITVENTGNVYDIIYLNMFGDYNLPNIEVNFNVPRLEENNENLYILNKERKYIKVGMEEEIKFNFSRNNGFGIGLKGKEKKLLKLEVRVFGNEKIANKRTYKIGLKAVSMKSPDKTDELVTITKVFDKKISKAIENGKISAIFYIHDRNGTDEVFEEGMIIRAKLIESKRIHFEVSANFSKGRIIVVDVDNEKLKEFGRYYVLFDNLKIEIVELDKLLETNSSIALYAVIKGENTTQFLIWIPHFSTHTIRIESQIEEVGKESSNKFLFAFALLPIGLMVGYTYGWKRKSKESVFKEFKLGTITEEKKKEKEGEWDKFLDFLE